MLLILTGSKNSVLLVTRSKKQNKVMAFIHVLLNMCLVENLKVYRLILERSLLMVLFLSLSFLNIYVEFGLSHFIISSFKRDLIRSSFRATDDTVYLGVVQYIFGSCQDIFLSSCFLTYKSKESLCKYRDSISATRIKTISNKIARLMESYFDAQEIAVLSQILKLAVVDVTSDHIYYPTIPEEVVDIIERNGLHYE